MSAADCLPIKSENCQEGRLQVEHFTPSIPDAIYRFRKHERKGKFRYYGLKSRGIFIFRFPSFFFFLVQCFWSWEFTRPHFRGKPFGELKTYGFRRKEVQVVSGGFSSPFSAQLYIFFVFLSDLLDLIVLAFYFILILILLFCHIE